MEGVPVSKEELAKLSAADREAYKRVLAESQNWETNSAADTETPRATPDPDDPGVPTIAVQTFVHRKPDVEGNWKGRLYTKMVDRDKWLAQESKKSGRTLGPQGTEIIEWL